MVDHGVKGNQLTSVAGLGPLERWKAACERDRPIPMDRQHRDARQWSLSLPAQ
jgi:hypothetical protein